VLLSRAPPPVHPLYPTHPSLQSLHPSIHPSLHPSILPRHPRHPPSICHAAYGVSPTTCSVRLHNAAPDLRPCRTPYILKETGRPCGCPLSFFDLRVIRELFGDSVCLPCMRLESRDSDTRLYISSLPFSILALCSYPISHITYAYAYAYAYAYTDARVQTYVHIYIYIYIYHLYIYTYTYIRHSTCAVDYPVRNDTDSFAPQRCRRRG
jgi:hypothetical protein